MAWTDERTELCKTLWVKGYSASQIADRVGGITRNAVIGKIHRLGLSHTRPRSTRHATLHAKRRGLEPMRRAVVTYRSNKARDTKPAGVHFRPGAKLPNAPRVSVAPLPPEPQRPAKLVSFEKLTETTCRFIYGDPKGKEDWGYCTCEKAPGSSYCAGHHGKVFDGVPVRMRKTPSDIGMWSKLMPAEFEVLS